MTWVRALLCKLQKGCTRLAAASDKIYRLPVHGRWFFPGTPASSTTKTGYHDIAESGVKHQNQIKSLISSESAGADPGFQVRGGGGGEGGRT